MFHLPEGDLATARLGEMTIYFLPSGAFLLHYADQDLLDIGLVLSRNNYKIRARQARVNQDVFAEEHFPGPKDEKTITWRGGIRLDGFPWTKSKGRAGFAELEHPGPDVPCAQYEQRVLPVPGGIAVRYDVWAKDREVKLDQLGLTVTLPIQHWRGCTVRYLRAAKQKAAQTGATDEQSQATQAQAEAPESWVSLGKPLSLPEGFTKGKPLLRRDTTCQRIELEREDGLRIVLQFDKPTGVRSLDGRQWENYYYWLDTYERLTGSALQREKRASFGLTLLLHPPEKKAPAPPAAEQQAVGDKAQTPAPAQPANTRVAALPEDTQTRGHWIGKYGRFACVLFGMAGYHLCQGWGWPLPFTVSTDAPQEPGRYWIARLFEREDKRPLYNPNDGGYCPAILDDHGEVRPLGKGPNLHLNTVLPEGTFVASLYFFEIDWPQYRRYTVRVKTSAGQLTAVVGDFFNGKYVRFLVPGGPLRISIYRELSPNAIVSGFFVDEVTHAELTGLAAGSPPTRPLSSTGSTGATKKRGAVMQPSVLSHRVGHIATWLTAAVQGSDDAELAKLCAEIAASAEREGNIEDGDFLLCLAQLASGALSAKKGEQEVVNLLRRSVLRRDSDARAPGDSGRSGALSVVNTLRRR